MPDVLPLGLPEVEEPDLLDAAPPQSDNMSMIPNTTSAANAPETNW
ncbi:MAG: hypothetical protein ACXVZJ_01535 [Terriglobales bacterium]